MDSSLSTLDTAFLTHVDTIIAFLFSLQHDIFSTNYTPERLEISKKRDSLRGQLLGLHGWIMMKTERDDGEFPPPFQEGFSWSFADDGSQYPHRGRHTLSQRPPSLSPYNTLRNESNLTVLFSISLFSETSLGPQNSPFGERL